MVHRRQFLRLVSASAVGLATTGCSAGLDYDVRTLARPDLLATLGSGPTRSIGVRYRALNRSEADVDALRAAILASRPYPARFFGLASAPVAALVRADFEHGRTVVVDGWILSVTEARQCALFSLLTG